MSELYVVKIDYDIHMKFFLRGVGCDVKIFSSKEKAEEFLTDNGFVYGKSCFFEGNYWCHSMCIKPRSYDVNRLVSASIERMKIDDENDECDSKYITFILGEESRGN